MARKLPDAEFAERTRAANRRRTERYHQRMLSAGKSALTVWIPESVRQALTAKAANDGATIQDTAAALLSAALSSPADFSKYKEKADADLFSEPPALATGDRDQQILALKRQGLSGYAIAQQVGCSEPTVRRALKRVQNEEVAA